MNLFKTIPLSSLAVFLGLQASFASEELGQSEEGEHIKSVQIKNISEANSAFFRSVCVYLYDADQEKEVPDFRPKSSEDLWSQLEEFGPVHVNLIDNELSDGTLEKISPFSKFIYALSLEGNCFSAEELEKLSIFQELKFLDLTNALPLVNPSLKPLYGLKNLEVLVVTYNRGLNETMAIDELIKIKPDIKVINVK